MKKFLFMRCGILRLISIMLTAVLLVDIFSVSVFATETLATPTNSKVTINGVEVKFDAYNINGNNYFKLRDIAYSLADTEKRFSVNWVAENNSANLITGEEYVPIGGEMNLGNNEQKTAALSNTNIMVNGESVNATVYLIYGSNYFKLRDLGTILGFGVDWDEQNQTVVISSVPNKANVEVNCVSAKKVNLNGTQSNKIELMGKDSDVQQFLYKDEGMAYAYSAIGSDSLEIILPNNKFTVEKLYPILGDVISDKDGNIYVIWGRVSEIVDNKKQQSIFISKYSSNGDLILSRGIFDSRKENMYYISKEPFSGSNTVSAIHNNALVISFGKLIYENKRQCGGVVAVDLNYLFETYPSGNGSDWSVIGVDNCYGNDIAWHDKLNEFYFVSEGTEDRGFNLSSHRHSSVIFDFYLQPDANSDTDIISQTFAQMGGLIRTDKSFVFCGASAKSISEEAKNESQNLFIQMFDVDYDHNVTYIGGETREGLTARNFYEENSTMKSVTNNGVIWLTDYSKESVVRPQIVRAEDKFVIIWSIYEPDNESCKKTAYMVLSDEGEILVPETALDCGINSYEKPIYHNGIVSWVYYDTSSSQLQLVELKVK
ncbi:MAG: hypothetical protein E7395_01810 [Ruminococcaceae bacterium]|nr:hypothetical protein [Oscillospiraceae bacterium]